MYTLWKPYRKKKKKKKKKKNKNSLSLEKEKIFEIFFIEKNYPIVEVEKFFNHYSKTDWIDKNGNKVTDVQAAARNWDQKSSPVRFYIAPEFHKLWKEVWMFYKGKIGFEKALHLLKVKPSIYQDKIIFSCDNEVIKACEKNIEFLGEALRKVFGPNIKLEYKVIQSKIEKAIE